MYLAFIWIEVLCSLWAIEWDAFHHAAIDPSLSVIVAQYAEDSVSLQRAVAAHHQPPFSWAVAFLPCKDMKNEDLTENNTGCSPKMIMITNKVLILEYKQLNIGAIPPPPPSPGYQNQAQG